MRILGVDPGLVCTGLGIIEVTSREHCLPRDEGLQYLHSELCQPPRTDLAQRLLFLHEHLASAIRLHRCEVMAVEDQFFGTNVQTAFKTGQARGAALLAAAHSGIPVALYAPARVKMAVVGNGQASKEQVRFLVQHLLKLPPGGDSLPLDCSDALAVALCHAFALQIATVQ